MIVLVPAKRASFEKRGREREGEIIHSDLLKVNGSTGVSVFREAGGDLQTKYTHAQGVAWHV